MSDSRSENVYITTAFSFSPWGWWLCHYRCHNVGQSKSVSVRLELMSDSTYIIQSFQSFYSCSLIAHCDQSRDFSIRMVESHVRFRHWNSSETSASNTVITWVSDRNVHCAIGTNNSETTVHMYMLWQLQVRALSYYMSEWLTTSLLGAFHLVALVHSYQWTLSSMEVI